MLSGIWPRGSSSAPGSGNTGITSGRSPGPRYSALIGICVPLLAQGLKLRGLKNPGRESLTRYENRIVDSRLRPSTVASSVGPQASKNCTSCLRAPSSFHLRSRLTISSSCCVASVRLAAGVERGRQIESGLMIERVCGDFLFQLGHRAERLAPARRDRSTACTALTAASLRLDSGTIASVCLACSIAPVAR